MLRAIFNYFLVKFEKNYVVSKEVTNKQILATLLSRMTMLIRGILRTRKMVFLGRGVRLRNVKNIKFGKACTIEERVHVDGYAKQTVSFGNRVKIGANTKISITSHLENFGTGLNIGHDSAIGEYSYLGCSGGVIIGNDVIMGQYVSFHSQNHNYQDKTRKIREQGVKSEGIEIGNNIWVGAKATFLDGCKVSDNSIVASGAVVTDKFSSGVVIGGVPARVIKEL
jgi:acetyltransferase-like isoleucine patch superfamily enzyme